MQIRLGRWCLSFFFSLLGALSRSVHGLTLALFPEVFYAACSRVAFAADIEEGLPATRDSNANTFDANGTFSLTREQDSAGAISDFTHNFTLPVTVAEPRCCYGISRFSADGIPRK